MSYIEDVIKSTGEERATLKKVDSSNVNKWGDATEEEVDEVTVSAVFELISAEAEEVAEGDFQQGDLRAYIPLHYDGVVNDNVLIYQGAEYTIDEVMKMEIGNEGHYEVRARQA